MTGTRDYGFIDRLLHRFAFATWPIQTAIADIEGAAFRSRLAGVSADRPVFVAGLPRAGTTLMLELIEGTGEFASYRYRDMPFLLTPLLWTSMTKSASRKVDARERAHGDGMEIDIDSPEAFEEVVWRALYPRKYRANSIETWRGGVDRDKQMFLRAQMQKIVAIRSERAHLPKRYLSKCNGNIARFATIARMFPDAVIIAPYRRPLDHAGSLLRQHLNFLRIHAHDKFARDYMAGIGHYDFGENLKPINFSNWLASGPTVDFSSISAWLRYWCAAYDFLLSQALPIFFISYDALCEDAPNELAGLEWVLQLAKPGAMLAQLEKLRSIRAHSDSEANIEKDLLERAGEIHGRLRQRRRPS